MLTNAKTFQEGLSSSEQLASGCGRLTRLEGLCCKPLPVPSQNGQCHVCVILDDAALECDRRYGECIQ